MNLNPSDGNIMKYCNELWYKDLQHGNLSTALTKDYVSRSVRQLPVKYIAIIRHSNKQPDAVKVWEFNETGSLLSKFKDSERTYVTIGGHIHEEILTTRNFSDDPIFSTGGHLIFNYKYFNNGVRIVPSQAHLSVLVVDTDNTYVLLCV